MSIVSDLLSRSHEIQRYPDESDWSTLSSRPPLDSSLIVKYTVEILEGLHYLHLHGIAHGNLQRGNIHVTSTGSLKLSAFGFPVPLRARKDPKNRPLRISPPEVLEHGLLSTKSDVWSLGCVVIEMITNQSLTGRSPSLSNYGQHALTEHHRHNTNDTCQVFVIASGFPVALLHFQSKTATWC